MSESVGQYENHNPRANVLVKNNVLVNGKKIVDPGASEKGEKVAEDRNQNKGAVQLQSIRTTPRNRHPLTQGRVGLKGHWEDVSDEEGRKKTRGALLLTEVAWRREDVLEVSVQEESDVGEGVHDDEGKLDPVVHTVVLVWCRSVPNEHTQKKKNWAERAWSTLGSLRTLIFCLTVRSSSSYKYEASSMFQPVL